jgi:ferredoxin
MVAAKIMGFKDGEIDITRGAQERGFGPKTFEQIDILGERLDQIPMPQFVLPSNRLIRTIPNSLLKLVAPLVWVRPNITDGSCINCNICVENCPTNTIRKGGERPHFDYTNCINCMCCHELCPEKAVYLEKSRIAKRIG